MPVYILSNGTRHVATSVVVPEELHAFAKREGISFSSVLRQALEREKTESEKGCDAPTTYPSRRTNNTRHDGGMVG